MIRTEWTPQARRGEMVSPGAPAGPGGARGPGCQFGPGGMCLQCRAAASELDEHRRGGSGHGGGKGSGAGLAKGVTVTVQSVGSVQLRVKTKAGITKTVVIGSSTAITQGGQAVSASAIKVGQTLVVKGSRNSFVS